MSFQRGAIDVYNPPFVINVRVSQKLNEFVPLFTGYVLANVSSTAGKNPARAMFQDLLQQDDRALTQLVQELANLTQFAVDAENLRPDQVELAIRNLVVPVTNGYLAMAVDMYPQQFGQVLNPEQSNEVGLYINALNTIRQQANDFYNQNNQGNGWGSQNNQNSGGYGGNRAANNRGGNGWNNNQNNQGYGNARSGRWDEPVDDNNQGGYQPVSQDRWPGNKMGSQGNGSDAVFSGGGGGAAVATQSTGGTTTHSRPAREFQVRRGVRTSVDAPQEDPRVSIVDGHRFYPPTANMEWPRVINDKRIWDWILMEDGSQLRPAYQSTWKPAFDSDRPVTPWFDSQDKVLFHYKSPTGEVSERLLDREKTMEYLDHELDVNLRRVAKEVALAREGKAAPAWDMVEQLRPNPSSPLATTAPLGEDAKGEDVRAINPTDFLKTTSLADAIKRASLKLKVDHPGILNEAFELYIERAVLTTVLTPDFDLLYQMANADSFKKLFQLIVDSDADQELLNEVDARVVAGINEAMVCHMGLKGWLITNFREDFGDLLAALKEDYGDAVINYLEEYAIEIISRALSYYGEKELAAVRETVGLEESVVALVWRERSSVTRLPINAEQVHIPVDTGVMVSGSIYPEMYKTLSSVFLRTTDVPHVYHGRYLVTTDGVVYAMYNGYLGKDAVLVYKANVDLK